MTDDEKSEHGVSRRTMLKRIGAAGAVAWITPVVTSLNTPAFAASGEHPECQGATCETFENCASSNPDCICVSTDQGGFCVPGSTQCAGLGACPSGSSSECGPDEVCASNTCCGSPVCAPVALTDACPADTARVTRQVVRVSTGAGTLGG